MAIPLSHSKPTLYRPLTFANASYVNAALSGDFSSFAGDGSSEDENNEDGQGKKIKVTLSILYYLQSSTAATCNNFDDDDLLLQ